MSDESTDTAARVAETLMGQCARPACRKPFAVEMTVGRPRRFCSDECRREADTEFKRALSRAAHFEKQLAVARLDLATFCRDEDPQTGDVP